MRWLHKILLSVTALLMAITSALVFASPGDLDPAFGANGEIRFSSPPNVPRVVLVQADGRIVVVDSPASGVTQVGGVSRFNADGSLDLSYGNGTGHAIPGVVPCGCDVAALQSDGKLVVSDGFNLVRLLANGSIDITFGAGGVAAFPPSPYAILPSGIAITSDGRIVYAGVAIDYPNGARFGLFRYMPNGSLDTSFGNGGALFTPIVVANRYPPGGFAQQPDGGLLLTDANIVTRLLSDGTPDATFGHGGVVVIDAPAQMTVSDLTVQVDGSIVVAGTTQMSGVAQIAVIRMDSKGNRDVSFGVNGTAILQVDPAVTSAATAIAVDSHGRILVAGTSGDLLSLTITGSLSFRQAVVARLNPDGSPDSLFAAHGVTTFWDGFGSSTYALAIQTGDRILVGSTKESAPQVMGSLAGLLLERSEQAAIFRLQGGEGSTPFTVSEGRAVEYFYASFGHYFVTATPNEIAYLDTYQSESWVRTGQSFRVWTEANSELQPVCRFFSGQAFAPKSSHFYTPYPDECAALKQGSVWQYEGDAFELRLPAGSPGQGTCDAGSAPLYRLYNNGQGAAPNHRYTDNLTVFDEMLAQGWSFEGEAQTRVFACEPASP